MIKKSLELFEAFGIELEYMVVDRDTMQPRPLAEQILVDQNGETTNEITIGNIDVSNELATHVLEFKSPLPTNDLPKLERDFADAIRSINKQLEARNAILAPGGIHPFMDPKTESTVWSSGDRSIYETYHRIFDCHRHGWLNLQSCHLNLPFANEEQFGRLHAAVILILPYLPALSASSPFIEGKHTGYLDTRLSVYSTNQAKVPQIAGSIIPESVFTFDDYQMKVLDPIYAAIAPHDPEKLLQYEWLNSRGAIARFDRNAIEIRVLDTQENPSHDLAICSLIIAVLEKLCALPAARLQELARLYTPEERKAQFMSVAQEGYESSLELRDLADLFQLKANELTVGELWRKILDDQQDSPRLEGRHAVLDFLLQEGSLAERQLARLGSEPSKAQLAESMRDLASCLNDSTRYLSEARV